MIHAWCVPVVLAAPWQAESAKPATSVVDHPPLDGVNANYVGHRAPLAPEPLLKLPVGKVRADGWLQRELERMNAGMFGRLPELSHWCRPEKNAWRSKDGSGENGWEELPYWLKGFTSLAYVVHDEKQIALAREWLEAILASQRDDGYFGPESNRAQPDLWPNMPVLWAMRTWYEATGDARILDFLKKYFQFEWKLPRERLLPESWQKVRGGDNLDVVHWFYDRTGEPWLLQLAQAIHDRTADWTGGIPSWHGVNFCQGFREPAQFFVQSNDPRHFAATLRNYKEMMSKFGRVPGGMFGADENCREGHRDPRQCAEACSMVEFMNSFEMLGAQTGDAAWFDRCEEVAFNSLPAAMDAELKSLHYLTAPNLVACDAADHSPGIENGGCMLAFSPDERYRCCQHNVAQGWPYFVEHLWMATRDGGLASAIYAPCDVTANVREGATLRVTESGGYPFDEAIRMKMSLDRRARFPLYLRVPEWCSGCSVSIANERSDVQPAPKRWIRIEREWQDGDEVTLSLPMQLRIRRFPENRNFAAIDRGPLTYSLALREKTRRIGGTDAWPTTEVTTESPWNWGLVLDETQPAAALTFNDARAAAADRTIHSFEDGNCLKISAKARRIPQWRLVGGLVGTLQESPAKSDQPIEEIPLVPMGCAHLRITAFPVIGAGPDAHEWKEPPIPPRASHVHDDPFALNDGVLPKNSIDHTVPRFTFWDHLGTTEWVQYDFKEPRKVAKCGVYWFDDTGIGRCRIPKSWRVLWNDGAKKGGEWREVEHASAYGVAPDRVNDVTFTPVTASALRLEVTLQPGFSAGMFEWTVGE